MKTTTLVVLPGGWLWNGRPVNRHINSPIYRRKNEFLDRRITLALIAASRGEDPGYYHEAYFDRVDPEHEGKTVTVRWRVPASIDPGCLAEAVSSSGEALKTYRERPLSHRLWGKEEPPTAYEAERRSFWDIVVAA